MSGLDETIDLVAFGNNAGQGLPLAEALPSPLRTTRGVVVYGSSLPERPAYEAAGYGRFCPRGNLVAYLVEAAEAAGRPAGARVYQHDRAQRAELSHAMARSGDGEEMTAFRFREPSLLGLFAQDLWRRWRLGSVYRAAGAPRHRRQLTAVQRLDRRERPRRPHRVGSGSGACGGDGVEP